MIYELLESNFSVEEEFTAIFTILYVLNLIFSVIAYKLGFAKSLPLLKSIIVYIMLIIGVFVLTIFNVLGAMVSGPIAPVTEVLILTSLVLAIYRYRLHKSRQAKNKTS